MLRYKTETSPGLVALYDIRPGNGLGPFLQPRSPHGATYIVSRDVLTLLYYTIPTLSVTTKGSWLPWGGLPNLSSALWNQ